MSATEEQKIERLFTIYNAALYGLVSGLWELFGETSFATAKTVGDKVVQALAEHGVEIPVSGDNAEAILSGLSQFMAEELGIAKQIGLNINENSVVLDCQSCAFRELTAKLEQQNIQPFSCIPMLISTTLLSRKLGVKTQIIGRKWKPEQEMCSVEFRLVA